MLSIWKNQMRTVPTTAYTSWPLAARHDHEGERWPADCRRTSEPSDV